MLSAVSRNPTRARVGAALALVFVALIVALSSASSAAAATLAPGVKVLDHDSNVLALFTSAKCAMRPRSIFNFTATAKSHGWTLEVLFWRDGALRFTGDHTYDVQFGPASAITVDVFAPDRTFYSTSYEPPHPPRAAGGMRLGPRGAMMSLGLFAVLAPDLQTGVAIAGGLQCNYPRRRR